MYLSEYFVRYSRLIEIVPSDALARESQSRLIMPIPLKTREREKPPDQYLFCTSYFARRVAPRRAYVRPRAWQSIISRDAHLSQRFIRARRCAWARTRATEPSRTASMRGEFITRCTTRCAVHGRHRKSVWEVVQAFGRAVSAKSYNFDGADRVCRKARQWRRGFNTIPANFIRR